MVRNLRVVEKVGSKTIARHRVSPILCSKNTHHHFNINYKTIRTKNKIKRYYDGIVNYIKMIAKTSRFVPYTFIISLIKYFYFILMFNSTLIAYKT